MFTESYLNLLILQYSDLPKAEQTITALIAKYEEVYNVILQFEEAFDVDTAVGVQLDTIGKVVGLNRTVPDVIPKVYFGFADTPNTDTFSKAPFFRTFDNTLTDTQLNDSDYRFFIKAKIAKNVVTAKMIDDDLSIQDAIAFMFGDAAYVSDNQDMTMTLYIDETYPTRLLTFLSALNLIPRPQAVGIKYAIIISSKTFGFNNNPNAVGFEQGKFARVITL